MARSHADARENPLVIIIVIIYVLFLLRVRLNAIAVGAGCTRLYCIVSIRIELAKEFFLLFLTTCCTTAEKQRNECSCTAAGSECEAL